MEASLPKLTDNEAYERLHAATLAIGKDAAETKYANSALEAVRRLLEVMKFAIVVEMEQREGERRD